MKKTVTLDKLPYYIIWIFGLLELVTVPVVKLINRLGSLIKNVDLIWYGFGFVIGGIGGYTVFFILNKLIYTLGLKINNEKIKGFKSLLLPAFWGGMILSLIFALQLAFTAFINIHYYRNYLLLSLLGFFSTFPSVLFLGWLYQISVQRMPFLAIKIIASQREYQLADLSKFLIALLAGLYEAVAIPVMHLFILYLYNFYYVIAAGVAGVAGGIVGGVFIVLLYRVVAHYSKIQLVFSHD